MIWNSGLVDRITEAVVLIQCFIFSRAVIVLKPDQSDLVRDPMALTKISMTRFALLLFICTVYVSYQHFIVAGKPIRQVQQTRVWSHQQNV